MSSNKQLNEFSARYLSRYSKKTTGGHEVEENFGDEYFASNSVAEDKIDRIAVNYHRSTKLPFKHSSDETSDKATEVYFEQLTIDRKTGCIEFSRLIDPEYVVSHQYRIPKGVARFLDSLNANSLFDYIEGNPDDVIEDPSEARDYTIIVDYRKRPQRFIKGSYDKRDLPEDWPEFIEDLSWFMRIHSLGDIFNSSLYFKEKRRASDYIFCSVAFTDWGKTYYYLTEDDTIEIEDWVIVPAGKDNHTAMAEVVDIEYFSKETVPFPIEKTKHIIRKCSDDDLK